MSRPSPRAPRAPPQVRAATATEALRQLAAAGHSPEAACRDAGLRVEELADGGHMMRLEHAVALYEACARRSGDAYFGLHLGARGGHGMLGDLSYVARHAPNVGAALRNLARYASVLSRGVRVCFEVDGNLARLSYDYQDREIWPRRQDVEAAAAATVALLRSLLGPDWRPSRVDFEHDAPADLTPYERVLSAPVSFAQPGNALVIEAGWLNSPVPGADGRLLAIVEAHLSAALSAEPTEDPLVRAARDAIARSLSDGDVGIDGIARHLAVSPRTLQRRLGEQGVAFRELVDGIRRDLALRHLQEDRVSLTELAFILGYSELSAFNRAFRRWTGTSPLKHLAG